MSDMTEEQRAAKIAALVLEREGCLRRAQEDRVAAIDAELARLGAEGSSPAKRAARRKAG